MHQMTIFDMIREEYPPLDLMTEQEAVERVGKALGLTFKYNDFLEQWECRVGSVMLDVSYSHYDMIGELDGKLFISVGYENRKTKEGGGAPRDSLEEAIEWFRRRMENESEGLDRAEQLSDGHRYHCQERRTRSA